jgi:hypothetical protein
VDSSAAPSFLFIPGLLQRQIESSWDWEHSGLTTATGDLSSQQLEQEYAVGSVAEYICLDVLLE